MRVLWFTSTPSLYEQGKHNYQGCGWIESLEGLIRKVSGIKLAVAFFHPQNEQKKVLEDVTYYPVKRKRARNKPLKAIVYGWQGKTTDVDYEQYFLNIIEDFKPDVIQVYGTEGAFGLIQRITPIPVLMHLQGLINPCSNTPFPIGYSKLDFIISRKFLLKNLLGLSPVFIPTRFKNQAEREREIFSFSKYVCGRTDWDKQLTYLLNRRIRYFHIDEVLRPVFYEVRAKVQDSTSREKFIIFSTLSATVYKGIEVVLRTAKQFKELTGIRFEWRIAGIDASTDLFSFFEKKEGINHDAVHIKPLGVLNGEQLVEEMLNADVFVHPSYIDNSPNSVCEAQMLGLPVIACNVGGVNSLITHNESGFLVPSNGVYEFVYYLQYLHKEVEIRNRIGQKAKEVAESRHDRKRIVKRLLTVYSEIKTD